MGRRALRDSDIIHFIRTIIGKNRAIDERSFHIWKKNGKAEDEGGANSLLAAGKHRAPVSSGSGPDKGQTQAGPAGIAGGVRGQAGEGFENVLELIDGNASPLVFHPYLPLVAFTLYAAGDHSMVGAVLEGIVQQVLKHPAQQTAIPFHPGK